jgi:three-Cys-motif partner protein
MVILSQGRFPEILYIDGFAGPGEYAGGEAGSPIIALDTALGFKTPLSAKVHFLFVEERNDRAAHLRLQVGLRTLPPNFSVVVEGGVTFEAAFTRLYPSFVRNGRLIPTFAFIDPFGWTGAPFSLVKRILAHRSCEVFVNFMYEKSTGSSAIRIRSQTSTASSGQRNGNDASTHPIPEQETDASTTFIFGNCTRKLRTCAPSKCPTNAT